MGYRANYYKRVHVARPSRDQLDGYSPSELKTLLKRIGHKVPRDFFGRGCISTRRSLYYRWRHWGDHYTKDETFVVDISCPKSEFDRWANSVDYCITFKEYVNAY